MSKHKNPRTLSANTNAAEVKHPAADYVRAVTDAETKALHAQAAVGQAQLELLNLCNAASQANQEAHAAHVRAAMSVGIDPNHPTERWRWDARALGYVREPDVRRPPPDA